MPCRDVAKGQEVAGAIKGDTQVNNLDALFMPSNTFSCPLDKYLGDL